MKITNANTKNAVQMNIFNLIWIVSITVCPAIIIVVKLHHIIQFNSLKIFLYLHIIIDLYMKQDLFNNLIPFFKFFICFDFDVFLNKD
jgi:hypothetical protein